MKWLIMGLEKYAIVVQYFTAFLIIIGNSSTFIYFYWYLKGDNIHVKFNTNTQTTVY